MIRAVATKLSLTPRLLQRGYARVRTVEVSTGFDDAWRNMNETQKAKTIADYSAYESQDWHTLTLEQKRASILHSPIPHLTLVYTISYGPPEINDPYEGYKVFGGVLAICALGISVFAFARSKAKPPPKTLSPEYQRAQEEYLRRQNCDPIFGISSQNDSSNDELKL